MVDNTMFRRAKIVRIEGMVNPMATVQWSDGDHPTELRLVNILYTAGRIQDSDILYSARRMLQNGDRLRDLFSNFVSNSAIRKSILFIFANFVLLSSMHFVKLVIIHNTHKSQTHENIKYPGYRF